jgi:hypothetical protein
VEPAGQRRVHLERAEDVEEHCAPPWWSPYDPSVHMRIR